MNCLIAPLTFASRPASWASPSLLTLKILSTVWVTFEFTIVCEPEIVKFPETVRSPPIVGFVAKPIVIVSPLTAVTTSLFVPFMVIVSPPSIDDEPLSPAMVNEVEIAAVWTVVTLPWLSTVMTGIAVELPKLPGVVAAFRWGTANYCSIYCSTVYVYVVAGLGCYSSKS